MPNKYLINHTTELGPGSPQGTFWIITAFISRIPPGMGTAGLDRGKFPPWGVCGD